MKLGLIARADNSGLGMQTWEFYKHMKPDKVLVVDISHLNGNPVYPDRFNSTENWVAVANGFPSEDTYRHFLEGLDVVFVAESAYNPRFYRWAREMGVKTAVQYNYEFFDWFTTPPLDMPDLFIAPSRWHYEDVERIASMTGKKHAYLHCPVNRDLMKRRSITGARTFLHTAGRPAAHDRNGTKTVIEASKHLKTDAQIVVHFQGRQGLAHQATHTTNDYIRYLHTAGNPAKCKVICQELVDNADIYAMGDVLVLPRRYGGNCLPLNEALSVGLPAIMTDISPNNELLPPDWLIPAAKIDEFTPRTTIDIYGADPVELAARIDEMYEMSTYQIASLSARANAIAETISWEAMGPQYQNALEALCN